MGYLQIKTLVGTIEKYQEWNASVNEFLRNLNTENTEVKINGMTGDKLVAVIIFEVGA